MKEREYRLTEFPIETDPLTVEVWFNEHGEIGVAVFSHGVNDIAKRFYTLEELYDAAEYPIDEPTEQLAEKARVAQKNHQKHILKAMAELVDKKGYRRKRNVTEYAFGTNAGVATI